MIIEQQVEGDWKTTAITCGRLRYEVTEPIPPEMPESMANATRRGDICPAVRIKISDGKTPAIWEVLFEWSRTTGPYFWAWPFNTTVEAGSQLDVGEKLIEVLKRLQQEYGNSRCWLTYKELFIAAGMELPYLGLPPWEYFSGECLKFHTSLSTGEEYVDPRDKKIAELEARLAAMTKVSESTSEAQ